MTANPSTDSPLSARSLICSIAEHGQCDGNAPNGPAGIGHPCACNCHRGTNFGGRHRLAAHPESRPDPLAPEVIDRTPAADMTDEQYRAWLAAGHPAKMPESRPDPEEGLREAWAAMREPTGHPKYGEPERNNHRVGAWPQDECEECGRIRAERWTAMDRAVAALAPPAPTDRPEPEE
jgi:hypothetical protein